MKFCALFLATIASLSVLTHGAPVPVTGTMTYTQNFDSLGTATQSWADDSTLPGWYTQANSGATVLSTIQAGDGSTGQNGLLNLGTSGSPERALGTKSTGSGNLANMAVAVQFQNTGDSQVRVSRITYTGELWRTNDLPDGQEEIFTVYSAISPAKITNIISGVSSINPVPGAGFVPVGTGANWSSPNNIPTGAGLNGNASGNRTTLSVPLTQLTLNPGDYLVIKWTDTNLSSNDGHQGLDDVQVQFTSLAGVMGVVDPSFEIGEAGGFTMFQQVDQRIVLAGQFNDIGGEDRDSMARVLADGSADPSFITNELSSPFSVALLDDGGYVVGEAYLNRNIDKLNADGTQASPFNTTTNDTVSSLIPLADGRIIISGHFTTVLGSTRNRIARINANGTLDTSFNPNVEGGWVFTMVPMADGKIMIGGQFTTVGTTARARIARLNANGTVDTSFNATIGGSSPFVYSILQQPDGKLVIGGTFSSVSGSTRNRIARLNADGTLDATFNPNANDNVDTTVLQCDGRILIGGNFTTVGGAPRAGIARLLPTGALDTNFSADVSANGANGLWVQADGKILAVGAFTKINGVEARGAARLVNDPATQSLVVPGPGQVRWLRGGTAPEILGASFDLSTNGGGAWTALGAGTRVAGGWQLNGLTLPPAGMIRARTRLNGGYHNGTSAPWQMVTSYALPEIAVEQPAGTGVADGGTVNFGNVDPGAEATLTFTIRNSGPGDLTGISATVDGADAGSFTLSSPPPVSVPASGGSATFSVKFLPSTSGAKTAVLHLVSNDPDENPFDITLSGTALTELEVWRQTFFGTTANTGPAANNADSDLDGLDNLVEFAFGLRPDRPNVSNLPAWIPVDDGFLLEFTALRAGVTYVAEYNSGLAPATWITLNNNTAPPLHRYFVSDLAARGFMRLRVTIP